MIFSEKLMELEIITLGEINQTLIGKYGTVCFFPPKGVHVCVCTFAHACTHVFKHTRAMNLAQGPQKGRKIA